MLNEIYDDLMNLLKSPSFCCFEVVKRIHKLNENDLSDLYNMLNEKLKGGRNESDLFTMILTVRTTKYFLQ